MQLKVAATQTAEQWAWLKAMRSKYLEAPVASVVHGRVFQHTKEDELLMATAIEKFATNQGMKGPMGGQLWKDINNQVDEYALPVFVALYDELKTIKADTYSQVFEHCEGLSAMLPLPTDHQALTEAYWIGLFGQFE